MGKIEDNGFFGDITGKIGDYVISRNGKKRIIRKVSKYHDRKTKPREKTKSRFKTVAEAWAKLSTEQRRKWNRSVKEEHTINNKKGKKITTGKGLFISQNLYLYGAKEAIIKEPLRYKDVQSISNLDVKILIKGSNKSINLFFKPAIKEETKLIIYATPILSGESEKVNEKLYREIGVSDSRFKSGDSIKAKYIKVFKKMPKAGDEISFKLRAIDKNSGISDRLIALIAIAKKLKI